MSRRRGNIDIRKALAWAKLCLFLIIVVGIPLYLVAFYRDYLFDTEWLRSLPIRLSSGKNLAMTVAILITAQALQVIISFIPGGPFQIAASYLYSVAPALLISLAGCVIGSAIAFQLAKLLGHRAMLVIWGEEKFRRYHDRLGASKALALVFLLYLIPAIPKDMICYVAGLSDMKFSSFITVSTAARIPGMIGNLLIGTFAASHNYFGVALTVICIAIIAVTAYIYRDKLMELTEHPFFKGRKE